MSAVRLFILLFAALALNGCAGMIVSAAADVAIETAKIPFKVGGAVVDVATDDDE